MIGMENRTAGFWLGAGALTAVAVCLVRSQYERKTLSLEETWITSSKIKKEKTFVFLSDLHDNSFGPENEKLLDAIAGIKPDAVFI